MLDLRRLHVLRAVVASGSITAAAANLGYSVSAISQQMTALEGETGVKLLERHGRGVRPTAAGMLLSKHAENILSTVADAESALDDLRRGRTGSLTVHYFASAGSTLIPPAVAQLHREHPEVRVELRLIDPGDPLPDVTNGEADVAIVSGSAERQGAGVRLVHLFDDPFRAVIPKKHPLTKQAEINLADLASHPWVGSERPAGSCFSILMAACSAAGFKPRIVAESDDYATAQAFVAEGMGVSLIPQLGLDVVHPGVEVRDVRNPEPIRAVSVAVLEQRLSETAVRLLLNALRHVAPSPYSTSVG